MRITESQLRRVIRNLIREAPLADLYPPRAAAGRAAQRDSYTSEYEEYGKPTKILGTRKFGDKLRKLMSSWPMEVWVAPAVVEDSFEGQRFRILEPSEIVRDESSGDPELAGVVREWAERTGAQGTLIVPYTGLVMEGAEVTPWMIVHAMFDFDEMTSSSHPAVEPGKELSYIVSEAVELLGSAVGYGRLREIEKVFTMGSARKGYFSKSRGELSDIENEAATQAVATAAGFKYNAAALDDIRRLCGPERRDSVDEAQELLDRAVELSPRAREAFMRGITGKVVVVNVT